MPLAAVMWCFSLMVRYKSKPSRPSRGISSLATPSLARNALARGRNLTANVCNCHSPFVSSTLLLRSYFYSTLQPTGKPTGAIFVSSEKIKKSDWQWAAEAWTSFSFSKAAMAPKSSIPTPPPCMLERQIFTKGKVTGSQIQLTHAFTQQVKKTNTSFKKDHLSCFTHHRFRSTVTLTRIARHYKKKQRKQEQAPAPCRCFNAPAVHFLEGNKARAALTFPCSSFPAHYKYDQNHVVVKVRIPHENFNGFTILQVALLGSSAETIWETAVKNLISQLILKNPIAKNLNIAQYPVLGRRRPHSQHNTLAQPFSPPATEQ